ncbi:MAG: histidinol dehydrogenase [Bacteroidetes bacterium]|nr:MAG: histidinol dehydrogenase [Bacteroidota bacterium]TAE71440.1 MAG: histidinol dehydrogenase [Bacteroidota bacterium]TAF93719.1 MAG: histidinol dehydrogenase [Bacteroidota bacterium]
MQVFLNPPKAEWASLLTRPRFQQDDLLDTIQQIVANVQQNGDEALLAYAQQFDGVNLASLILSQEAIQQLAAQVPENLQTAIQQAAANIRNFHAAQIKPEPTIETMPGVFCWRKIVGIEKVGIYIPGGTAPLFSTLLMLAIPAQLAQCKQIVVCTPPNSVGQVHPAIAYTAQLLGIEQIYLVGGAQAVAALALGTASVPKVYKIFGPGNQYVTAAKQFVQQLGTAIDMPAGPSEVCVLADDTAIPRFVASDLLSQAEHGADSQAVYVTTCEHHIEKVQNELLKQLSALPRASLAKKALKNSRIIYFPQLQEAIHFVNQYAAEHLIIASNAAPEIAEQITQAGSIFLGNYSPESVGDYASGTNHTLPTYGFATAYSGVSVDSFVKKITVQQLTQEGLENIGNTVITMAEAEELQAHANAVKIRLKTIANSNHE